VPATRQGGATVRGVSGPTVGDLALDWGFDLAAALAVAVDGGLYVLGVRRLAGRGRRWSVARSLAMAGALAAAVVATQSGIGRYEADRFWVHMIQHVLLGMVVPLLFVLAAPLTLALQTGRPGTRRLLRTTIHSPAARLVTHPLVGWCLFGGGLVVLYLTPLLDLATRNDLVHVAVHTHVVTVGVLFLAPLVGVDVLPGRLPHPARLLALLAAVPFHAIVALALVSARDPIAPQAYPLLDDQRTAAGLFWGAGEIFTLVAVAVVVRQWWTSEQRAEAREAARHRGHEALATASDQP
jgi:cytochrome c oxidase assembly factor CtaG